jgi:hypothetical protein
MKDNFECWMKKKEAKTENTIYAYAYSIDKISRHYSENTGRNIDIYRENDINLLENISSDYASGGKFAQYGNGGNGTIRNAIATYLRFFRNTNSETELPTTEQINIEETFNIESLSGLNLLKSNHRTSQITRKTNKDWPIWEHPSDDELYEIIKLSARYIKFLNPDIIREIVIDNQKHQSEWSQLLIDNNVNPKIYLWENSPCAFPGVRRYAGSKEIAYFRKHTELSNDEIIGALKLDDNDFPKQIWSFIFRGNKFQKNGPDNYSLAHLADHKEYKNRLSQEFLVNSTNQSHELYGLFTCPTNTAYIPSSLLRPTDFSPAIRKLLICKSHALYGHFCNILPPWIKLISCSTDKWDHTHFQWADPVGNIDNIKLFLDFRNETMKSMFKI